MKRFLLLFSILVLFSTPSHSTNFVSGGCSTNGCEIGEDWLNTNANELDAALEGIIDNVAAHGDTDATGTELNELTDGSREVTLHSHHDNEIFYATDYAASADPVSTTGGIQEALNACRDAGGGTVMLPRGVTLISGTDATSPLIQIPNVLNSSNVPHGACDLKGYGNGGNGQSFSNMKAGSAIRFTNMSSLTPASNDLAGLKVGIAFGASGQQLSGFSVGVANTDADTRAILCRSDPVTENPGSLAEPGEESTTEYKISDISVKGGSPSSPGKAIELNNCQEGILENLALANFTVGVAMASAPCVDLYNDAGFPQTSGSPPDGECDRDNGNTTGYWSNANNAAMLQNSTIREMDVGLDITQTHGCRHTVIKGLSFESNDIAGIRFSSDSLCALTDFGSRFEDTDEDGAVNVLIQSGGANYTSYGSFYSAGVAGGVTDLNISRTAAQTAGLGPDVIHNAELYQGVTATAVISTLSTRRGSMEWLPALE